MALPTKTSLLTGQTAYLGSPWIRITSKPAINTNTLEVAYLGSPWWAQPDTASPIEYINITLWASISQIGAVSKSTISHIMGVSTT